MTVLEDDIESGPSPKKSNRHLMILLGCTAFMLFCAVAVIGLMHFAKTDPIETHHQSGRSLSVPAQNEDPWSAQDDAPSGQYGMTDDNISDAADVVRVSQLSQREQLPSGPAMASDVNHVVDMKPANDIPRELSAQRAISSDEALIIEQINGLMTAITVINDELKSGTLKDVQLANKVNAAMALMDRATKDLEQIKSASSKLAVQVRDHGFRLVELERAFQKIGDPQISSIKSTEAQIVPPSQQKVSALDQSPPSQPIKRQEPVQANPIGNAPEPLNDYKVVATTNGSALLVKDGIEYVVTEGTSYRAFGSVKAVDTASNTVLIIDESGRVRIVN